MKTQMKLQVVPATRGAAWIRQGFGVFVHRPLAFSALFATFLFAVFATLNLPYIGPILMLSSLPLVTVAFMVATQQTLQGGSPTPAVFVLPLRVNRPRTQALIKLGLLYTLGSVAIMLVSHWFDGGKLFALRDVLAAGNAKPDDIVRLLEDEQLRQGMVMRLVLSVLLSLPFWYAPALVHWGGHTAAKALFFSSVAVWRNKLAFLVYGAAWFGAMFVFGLVMAVLLTMIGQPQWADLIAMPVALMFFTVMYASLFFTFIDSFEMTVEATDET